MIFITCICSSQTLTYKWTNPVNLNILNSSEDEFAPAWNKIDSCLYYNSCQDGKSKFYKAKKYDSITFSSPKLIEGGINQPGNNQSYITFYNDDRAMLSSFRMNGKRPYFNLFESILTRAGWSAPMLIESMKHDYNILHPTISADGKMLVVASDLNSSNGKIDLYISYHNDNGTWSPFEQIDELNTDGNEITPSFSGNDTLYFASDGQGGPGGFDIFFTIRNDQGKWSRPNPVNELNTSANESDFSIIPGGVCIFASNRPGGKGGLDLYIANKTRIITQNNTAKVQINLATQFTIMKATNDLIYQPSPLTNFILSDISYDELNNFVNTNNSNYTFNSIIDTNYVNSLNMIGKRLSENPDAELLLTENVLESKNKSFQFISSDSVLSTTKSFFINKYGINRDKIRVERNFVDVTSNELSPKPVLILNCTMSKILSQTDYGTSNITVDPPVMEMFVNLRPPENINEWTGYLFFDENTNYLIKRSNKASEQFIIDLTPYKSRIQTSDSVIFNLRHIDKNSDTVENSIHFDISHATIKKRISPIIDELKYDIYYALIPEEEAGSDKSYLIDLLNQIKDDAEFTRSIKIQFFSIAAQKRALSLLECIRKKLELKNVKVDIEQKEFNNTLPFNKRFMAYTFKILMEKF